jgi:uncharacterized membrane protein YqgA involved in biofilm formation
MGGSPGLPGLGTVVNVTTVVVGSLLGLAIGGRMPGRLSEITMQAVGGVTVLIGVQMALEASEGRFVIALLVSLVLGAIVGELLDIEGRLERLGRRLEQRFARDGDAGRFTKGFITTSLLFCVGPMTILGSIHDGLFGDATLLMTKSVLDGISAIAFSASLGLGVLLSAGTVFIVQGSLTLLAQLVHTWMTPNVVLLVTAAGGVMILGIGLNIWQVTRLRVGNMLPALVIGAILAYVVFPS